MNQLRTIMTGLLAATAATLMVAQVSAAPPKTALLEGLMTSAGGGAAADGVYDVVLSVYDAQSGGSAAWSEGPVKLAVKGGQFSYALGTTKALDAVKLAALKAQWLGIKVGTDPELPRVPVHAAIFALHANAASSLTCSGCVSGDQLANGGVAASKVGFTYAGSATKGGPASDLACTACVSVSELKFDGEVNLGTNALKGKDAMFSGTVAAASFVGDGSKLTGIKIPTGECKTAGEVVKGINADGSLKCVKAVDPTSLPKDALDDVSNGLITNQFEDTIAATSSTGKVPIPDNQGVDATWNLNFPDIGLAQDLNINVKIENTDLSTVSAYILPPDDKKTGWVLCDPCGAKDAKAFDKTYNPTNLPKSQNGTGKKLTEWIGQNPKDLWTLKVKDTSFCIPQQTGNAVLCNITNKTDGNILAFSIKIKTLSNKKVSNTGDVYVSGKLWGKDNGHGKDGGTLQVGGDLAIGGNLVVGAVKAKYGMFQEGSVPYLYRHVDDTTQGNWTWYDKTRTNYSYDVKDNDEDLRGLGMELRFGTRAGNISNTEGWVTYADSTNEGQSNIVLFIKNTTSSPITHNICYRWSGRDNSSRRASISINGSSIRVRNDNHISTYCDNFTFPANKSSMISMQCGGHYWTGSYNTYYGRYVCNFYDSRLGLVANTSKGLPKGLEYDYARYFKYVTY